MKTHGNDPVTGCIHGGSLDDKLKGLTKREWLFGCALRSYGGKETDPEKVVDYAYKCMEVALKRLHGEELQETVPIEVVPGIPV